MSQQKCAYCTTKMSTYLKISIFFTLNEILEISRNFEEEKRMHQVGFEPNTLIKKAIRQQTTFIGRLIIIIL